MPLAIGAGADHRPHPGLAGDAALPAAEQGEALGGRDRAFRRRRRRGRRALPSPGRPRRSIVSAFCARLVGGRELVDPRARPVVKARAGAASRTSGTAISAAAKAGAAQGRAASGGDAGARPARRPRGRSAPALIRSPSRASRPGRPATATTTLRAVATPTVVASESSSEPGWTKAERASAANSVAPAKTVVRPGGRPAAQRRLVGAPALAPAPRGSGRRSAASSRRRGRGPSSCRRRARARRSSSPS